MCGPMQGAIAGAIVFEGWASSLPAAMKLAASGKVKMHPNHHFGAVGPMTGITTRSMPVMIVENRAFGNRACVMINEGLGKVIEKAFKDHGRPNGYIKGEEAGGAITVRLRYGSGTLHLKAGGARSESIKV